MPDESAYTEPRAWQPHPEHWHATTSAATEHEVTELVAAFVRALQPETVIETGCNTGQTSVAIGWALWRNGHGNLFTVDHDETMVYLTRERCIGLPVTVTHGDSKDLPIEGPIGFGFFDSACETRADEIEHYWDRFEDGAVIGVHDTAPHHTVWGYLAPLIESGRLVAMNLRTPRGVCFAQVCK